MAALWHVLSNLVTLGSHKKSLITGFNLVMVNNAKISGKLESGVCVSEKETQTVPENHSKMSFMGLQQITLHRQSLSQDN